MKSNKKISNSIPEEVLQLIKEEQIRQNGLFVPEGDNYLKKLTQKAELILHYGPNNSLFGFVFFYANAADKKSSFITLIATSTQARGIGIGSSLVSCVLEISKQRGFSNCQLEVRKSNKRAIGLYKKKGFIEAEDRSSKLLMSLLLD